MRKGRDVHVLFRIPAISACRRSSERLRSSTHGPGPAEGPSAFDGAAFAFRYLIFRLYYAIQYGTMIPFRVVFRPGVSLYEQVVYAAKKAVIAGQLRAGDPFPSVRALSKELKINPNTATKW